LYSGFAPEKIQLLLKIMVNLPTN